MEFQIKGFFPERLSDKNTEKIGTVCVELVELKLEFKGISVFRNKDKFFFRFPGTYAMNHKKERVRYSFFRFLDEDMERRLTDFLISEFQKNFPSRVSNN